LVKINSDFRDLLRSLNAAGVRYMIVGGYAVMAYTEPRYTKDLDVWIEPTEGNALALFAALASFGAPTKDVTPRDFTEPSVFFQIGVRNLPGRRDQGQAGGGQAERSQGSRETCP
jgi:hypothetical protein